MPLAQFHVLVPRPTSLSWLCQLQRSLPNVSMGHGLCACSPTERVTVPELSLVTPRDTGDRCKGTLPVSAPGNFVLFMGLWAFQLVLGEHWFPVFGAETGLSVCGLLSFVLSRMVNISHCTSLSSLGALPTKNSREGARAGEPCEGSQVQLLQALTAVHSIRLQTRFKHLTTIPAYFSGSVPNCSHYY